MPGSYSSDDDDVLTCRPTIVDNSSDSDSQEGLTLTGPAGGRNNASRGRKGKGLVQPSHKSPKGKRTRVGMPVSLDVEGTPPSSTSTRSKRRCCTPSAVEDEFGEFDSPGDLAGRRKSPRAVRSLKRDDKDKNKDVDKEAADAIRQNQEAMRRMRESKAEDGSFEDEENQDSDLEVLDVKSESNIKGAPISLTLRTKCKWELTINTHQKVLIGELLEKFEETDKGKSLRKENGRPAKFLFDGDVLGLKDTPAKFEMEDEDVIDVY